MQLHLIGIHISMMQFSRLGKADSFFLGQCTEFFYDIGQKLLQVHRSQINFHLSAFNFGQVQYFVHQLLQVERGAFQLIQTVLQLLFIMAVEHCTVNHTHNSVERRTDFVAHFGEKIGFGLAGFRGNLQLCLCLTQKFPLCIVQKRKLDHPETLVFHDVIHGAFNGHISVFKIKNLGKACVLIFLCVLHHFTDAA